MISNYPPGSDITLMNTMYNFRTKGEDGKWIDDFLTIVYKDNKTGKKNHTIIIKPEYTFYKLKDGEAVPDHPLFFVEKEKTEPVTVPYNDLLKEIANVTDNRKFYDFNVANRNRSENMKLHTDPRVFWSDCNVEDHYRYKFSREYTNNITKLHKAYYDIECDTRYMAGDFVESGECPINMVSLHDDKENITITFILRNEKNPLIQKFEDMVASGEFNQKIITDFVIENVGGIKQAKRYNLYDTKNKILFFDDEIDLIASFFAWVHQLDPDFIMGWNSSAFDLQYFIDRIYTLGYEPADIMCNQTWEVRFVKNYIDMRNINEPAERTDYASISGNPVWLDQYIQFTSRRKATIGSFDSFKLDDIAKRVANVRKLSYHHITLDIAMLPYLDFITFFLYNVMDVVCQVCIEVKSRDVEYLFAKALINCTSYRKAHRQTTYLINRFSEEFEQLGFYIGNNINRWNEKPDKFLGALVGDPLKTNDYSKIKIDGRSIMVCDNLQDDDYKSLYPSIMGEFNIAPNTQIGRIDIDHTVWKGENGFKLDKYSRGGEFIENLVTDNCIEFCKRWLGLAGINEFLEDMDEFSYQMQYGASYKMYYKKDDKYVASPIYTVDKPIKAIVVGENDHPSAIYFFGTLEDSNMSSNYEDIINGNIFNATKEVSA